MKKANEYGIRKLRVSAPALDYIKTGIGKLDTWKANNFRTAANGKGSKISYEDDWRLVDKQLQAVIVSWDWENNTTLAMKAAVDAAKKAAHK